MSSNKVKLEKLLVFFFCVHDSRQLKNEVCIVDSRCKKPLYICNSTFMAFVIEITLKLLLYEKYSIQTMILWSLCAFIWFKNMKKMLLQMTSGFLQLESTLNVTFATKSI
jgi:hypothetical protein